MAQRRRETYLLISKRKERERKKEGKEDAFRQQRKEITFHGSNRRTCYLRQEGGERNKGGGRGGAGRIDNKAFLRGGFFKRGKWLLGGSREGEGEGLYIGRRRLKGEREMM